jgi:hypothetical protein
LRNSLGALAAKQREGYRIKAGIRDVLPTFGANPIGTLFDTGKRGIQQADFLQSSATNALKYLVIFQFDRLVFEIRICRFIKALPRSSPAGLVILPSVSEFFSDSLSCSSVPFLIAD